MLVRMILLLAVAGADVESPSEPRRGPNEEHAVRITELEETVAQLQAKLDAAVASESEPDVHNFAASPASLFTTPFSHGVVYDNGWTLRPVDPARTPFELKFSLHNQFRLTGFGTDEPFVVNSAGRVVPTSDRNDFGINRGRLIFSGYAIDPLLEFYANVDYNTVAERPIQMLMAWIRHPLDPAFNLAYGLGKVPGTWEWLESSRNTLGAERSLATTFFRPSMTAGVWIDGELPLRFHYHALIGNGFNTFTLNASELDAHLAYSGMVWWEPLGAFGAGFSDFEDHSDSVIRIGHALTYSQQDSDPGGEPGPEQTVVRLSDGTPLVETGSLAPGVTVNQFDLTLYAIHAGWKSNGFSLSAEYFVRWLTDIGATGPIPRSSILDQGFYAQVGAFIAPQAFEVFGRASAVSGPFGSGSELGTGFNWYIKNQRDWRLTVDVARVDRSPAQQDRTGFVAGASGILLRAQIWTSF